MKSKSDKDTSQKAATLWYDSDLFCLIVSIFAALVYYFSIAGIRVAMEHHQYQHHCWVPITLMSLSGILLVVNLFRILIRMINRSTEEE
ncbi:MAG: hypothetical protein BA872_07330 [Desulfobacterales bacterium C00003060]|nr:MAG: hypothetical protein BA861_02030 [Desulfobacterales bacterium S3730MH5]OEU79628.1 MAG: hypothetical protein BA872_07330 [Desulfobacterales bacterium C00003060]